MEAPILLVGGVGAGKSTLRRRLADEPLDVVKTQTMERFGPIIDSPGEYLEIGRLTRALLVASYDARLVVLVQAADDVRDRFPPRFASAFSCDVIGVVTKCSLADEDQVAYATDHLFRAGARTVRLIDSVTGAGIDELREEL